MKWSRNRDYHAYRSYADEAASRQRARGGFVAALIAAVKAGLKVVARPTPSAVTLSDGSRRGFSTLGTRSGLSRPADCPFPTASANVNRSGRH